MHSYLAPSSAHRWMQCPGSVELERQYPDNTRFEAAEGTALHEVAAMCLKFEMEPYDYLDHEWDIDGYQFILSCGALESMKFGLDEIRDWIENDKPDYVFIEKRFIIPEYGTDLEGNEQGGTTDCGLVFVKDKKAVIWDWKFGKGVETFVENNPQVLSYLLGMVHHCENELALDMEGWSFEIYVHQPRYGDGKHMRQNISYDDLLKFAWFVQDKAQEVHAKPNVFVPGDHCTFCKGIPGCKAYAEQILDQFDTAFEGNAIRDPDLNALTDSQKAWIVNNQAKIRSWLDEIHKERLRAAKEGKPTPGLELDWGKRGSRYFTDQEIAKQVLVKELGDDAFTERKLISPSQAESHLGKKRYNEVLKDYIKYGPRPQVLVPEGSASEGVLSIEDQFNE